MQPQYDAIRKIGGEKGSQRPIDQFTIAETASFTLLLNDQRL
jgi:hypothetical protein